MGKVIGIDLGTTNSCVAVMEGGQPVVIPNAEGERTTPSVVAFSKEGQRLVGSIAKRQLAANVDRTISSIKREMGTAYKKRIERRDYTPQEISAFILMKLKKDAESYLGTEVDKAVITVPAYFNDAQRQATKDAGRIAGLEVLRIINEPTSAALAYGLDHGQAQKILVYDLGGGTFDVSLIEIGDNLIEVLATAGNNHLGGDDFDRVLTNYIIEQFEKQERVNLKKDLTAYHRVQEAAEDAKKLLSTQTTATINLPFLTSVRGEAKHLQMDISRALFEQLTKHLIDQTEEPVRRVLSDAGISSSQLNMVLLVGGSTRIPAVRQKVSSLTGLEPSNNINPDECVALGAAIQGGKLGGEITTGTASEIILMDVTPLSLSIETVGGVATRLIDRNTTIPTCKSQIFSTAANFQSSVDIRVLQGERQFAKDNTLLGNFRLSGIKRALAGVPQIEVTFDIDANGIVSVSAKDLGTGKQQSITITSGSNMSDADIERAIYEAQNYEADDSLRMKKMQVLGEAQQAINQAQQYLAENKKTIEKEEKKRIKAEISTLQKMTARKKADRLTDGEMMDISAQTEKVSGMVQR
ncbi:MAG: molecular chaperone DnaK [Lachnospiraceae bacterium]|nr:molecular chaperone DnaK [Lachnospiraceae bacterium]